MASVLDTIYKSVFGNKRVHYGNALLLNGTTSGTIETGLHKVEMFCMMHGDKFTESAGVVTVTFADPGASEYCGWIAIGY